MDTTKKIALLQRLLDQAEDVTVRDSDDATFKTWRNTVERTLGKVFGPKSTELNQFKALRFFYHAAIMTLGADYSHEDLSCFDRDFKIIKSSIANYIEELRDDDVREVQQAVVGRTRLTRLFVSHSSQDVAIVEELVELIEMVGVPSEAIFCTSLEGYGIPLGENFLEVIKDALSDDTLVLFLLTPNFYKSPICLCEMGATWVQAKEHIPILVPPLSFDEMKGVIPLTQGFKLNDSRKLNLFKEKLETDFELSSAVSQSSWERKRDRFVERLNKQISILPLV